MNNALENGQAIRVSPDQATVCCRGASGALGHPAVYLTFADQSTVQCYYCGCVYTRAHAGNEHPCKAE
ncbi:MAG: zinc-finger domain-containing protein [Gammaproteobacteria bacterium]|nr:zinc-finger domain-containing protein [Gammaproteobacteria bacterium]